MIKPKALYIHIPFCEHICTYCDFPKLQYFYHFAKDYLAALEKELKARDVSKDLDTIYIGGGTPTSLDDDLFISLFEIIKPYTDNVKEFTVEANPESLTTKKIDIMKRFGVNRISIGVESTDDEILNKLNRKHTFDDVRKAVTRLKEAKIDNYNLDLIIGLPHVNKGQIINDINNLIKLEPKHISVYSLTIHEHTVLFNNQEKELEQDIIREYYDLVNDALTKAGYIHYEISNWAKPGYYSLHNLTYWRNQYYYGIGMGASGYINKEKEIRYTNTKNILKYNKGQFEGEIEEVSLLDKYHYALCLNLRTIEGLNLDLIKKEYDIDLAKEKEEEIKQLTAYNLIKINNNIITATYQGMMVLDTIIIKLM